MVNDCLACMAVVRIAFTRSILFCFRLRALGDTLGFRLELASVSAPSFCCASSASPSELRFLLPSGADASLTGQTNPVLGVYAGRCVRKESNEHCKECKEVSCARRALVEATERSICAHQTIGYQCINIRRLVNSIVHDKIHGKWPYYGTPSGKDAAHEEN